MTDNIFCPDHDIVASFKLNKTVSLLEDNILQLADDIFSVIPYPSTKVLALSVVFLVTYLIFLNFDVLYFLNQVVILSLEPDVESNTTKVVFAVDPDTKYSKISQTYESLIRENFVSLVIEQSPLSLNTSLFGDPFLFEVLKFPGGITITPFQSAFLLQGVQIQFNFTLIFSISEIQLRFNELKSQLKYGLHLAPYEVWQSFFFFFLLEYFHYAYHCLRLICDVMVACFRIPMPTNFNVQIEGSILPTIFIYILHMKILCGCFCI